MHGFFFFIACVFLLHYVWLRNENNLFAYVLFDPKEILRDFLLMFENEKFKNACLNI